jgi:hypothetical protein
MTKWKAVIAEVRKVDEGLNGRFELAEERIPHLEDQMSKAIQFEKQRGRGKSKQNRASEP